MTSNLPHISILLLSFLVTSSAHSQKNEFADTIKKANEQFQAGRLSEAERQLQFAQQIIRDQRSLNLKACLPTGLPGWSIEESTTESSDSSIIGLALIGNNATAKRVFKNSTSRVECSISSDPPLLQQFAAILNSPLMNIANNSRLEQINGEVSRVTYDESERNGELILIYGSRFLINVKGTDISRADLVEFAKKFDFATLSSLK